MGPTAVTDLDACVLARFPGTVVPDWLLRWLDDGLGGVVLFAGNIAGPGQLRSLTAQLRGRRPDLLIAVDEEGGDITRLEARTGSSYPGNLALGAGGDASVTRAVAAGIGAMLATEGINLDLAPVADVDASPANPIVGVRSFGSAPAQVAEHVAAFIAGLQGGGIAACAKHFPGHGAAEADSHLVLPVIRRSLAQLRECDLVPFRAAIAAGVQTIMTAHVVFPDVDDRPATLSHRWLTDVLRGELGFGGVIITDALGMSAIDASVGCARGAVLALTAGADLLCMPADPDAQRACRAALAAAAGDGRIPRERIAEAAARIRALAAVAGEASGPGRANGSGTTPAATVLPDASLSAAAARRALVVDVTGVPLRHAPYVLDAGGRASTLLEDTAGSLLHVLREREPGVSGIRLADPVPALGAKEPEELVLAASPDGPVSRADLDAMLGAAAGRPVVVVVRDAQRQPWQRRLVGHVRAARPDALIVGTGTTRDHALAPGRYLGTRGSARPNLAAAADVLLGAPG